MPIDPKADAELRGQQRQANALRTQSYPPRHNETMIVASVQANVVFGDPLVNARKAIAILEDLAGQGVRLAVFPEAFLTGYCVECLADANGIAIAKNDPALAHLHARANELGILVIVGFAEKEDGRLYNTAALFEPGRDPRYYRKTHLPELGLDKFVGVGDSLPVFDTAIGKIGILICFDLRHPEPARVLALEGAELIAMPTNWPEGAQISANVTALARAAENRVFFVTCDRVGAEHGFSFIGLSKIISPTGNVLAAAGSVEEVLTAEVDLAEARVKRNVIVPGKFETTVFESRRPELYAALSRVKEPAGV